MSILNLSKTPLEGRTYVVTSTRLSLKNKQSKRKAVSRLQPFPWTHVDESIRSKELGQSTSLDLVDHGRFQIGLNRTRNVFVLAASDLLEVYREPLELLVLISAAGNVFPRLVQTMFLRDGSERLRTPPISP